MTSATNTRATDPGGLARERTTPSGSPAAQTIAATQTGDRHAEYRTLMRKWWFAAAVGAPILAAAMSFSSVTVISNANRLKRFRLQEVAA